MTLDDNLFHLIRRGGVDLDKGSADGKAVGEGGGGVLYINVTWFSSVGSNRDAFGDGVGSGGWAPRKLVYLVLNFDILIC